MGNRVLLWVLVVPLVLPPAGFAEGGLVALRTAGPGCADDTGDTYVDCGNGTVTDNRTGLVWFANANCYGLLDWHQAVEIVATLSDLPATSADGLPLEDCELDDGSSPGDWRLPTADEWERMVADAVALDCIDAEDGGPSITNDSGDSCWQEGAGSSFTGVVETTNAYWSSTTRTTDVAFAAHLTSGTVAGVNKAFFVFNYLWPVRGGQ